MKSKFDICQMAAAIDARTSLYIEQFTLFEMKRKTPYPAHLLSRHHFNAANASAPCDAVDRFIQIHSIEWMRWHCCPIGYFAFRTDCAWLPGKAARINQKIIFFCFVSRDTDSRWFRARDFVLFRGCLSMAMFAEKFSVCLHQQNLGLILDSPRRPDRRNDMPKDRFSPELRCHHNFRSNQNNEPFGLR